MAKNASGSINAKSIGVVKGLIGSATATDANGIVRELQVGDRVYANEVVQTSAAGTVHIEFGNNSYVNIGHGSTLALDKTVFDPNAKSGSGDGNLADMRAKIAAGADPTEVTDPTAAGPGAGGDGGEQGGHHAVFVQQNAAQGSLSVSQGFETSSASNPQAAAGNEGAVLRVNHDPVAEPGTAAAVEGGDTIVGNVIATDIDGDPLTYSLADPAPAGLIFTPDGSYSFDPKHSAYDSMAQGDTQTITVNYTVADAFGGTDSSTLTITLTGTNDTATITASDAEETAAVEAGGVANFVPGDPDASGTLTVSDVDHDENHFQTPASLVGQYGTFTFDPDTGAWTYKLGNDLPATQALNQGDQVTDTLTVQSHDGTASYDITVNIAGSNDNATITVDGTPDTAVIEAGGVANGTAGDPDATGKLTVTDVDAGEAVFQTPASLDGTYGTFTFSASTGTWTYALNNDLPATQALNAGDPASDSLTVTSLDGTASQVITVNITGANDTAVVTGTATDTVREAGSGFNFGDPFASGDLDVSDVDAGEAHFHMPALDSLVGDYGFFTFVPSSGVWTYTLNNLSPATQALNAGDTAQDTLTVMTHDGTPQIITVNITGTNDNAVIWGDDRGSVREAGGLNNASPGTQSTSGDLNIFDFDDGEARFQTPASLEGTYGTFTFNADTGAWTYTLDNSRDATQALNQGDRVFDSLTVRSLDGTDTETITVTINGSNDYAEITGSYTGNVVESGGTGNTTPGTPSVSGDLNVTDVDDGEAHFHLASSLNGTYGNFLFDTATGEWTYNLANDRLATQALNQGDQVTDTLTVRSHDGTDSQIITVNITGTNDSAAISGSYVGSVIEAGGTGNTTPGTPSASGDLNVTDVDAGEAHFHLVSSLNGTYGDFIFNTTTGAWTYNLANDRLATQALNQGDQVTDTLTVQSHDGTANQIITVNITGTNDTAIITGDTSGSVIEAGGAGNMTLGTASVSGNLNVSDVDDGEAHFHPTGSLNGTYGDFLFDSTTGEWAYNLDNDRLATQALNQGDEVTDTLTVQSHDGTSQTITVTITGHNDAPTISAAVIDGETYESGLALGTSPSSDSILASGTFTVGDVDGLANIKSVTIAGETFTVGSGGLAGLIGQDANTAHGTVTITGYDNGVFNYEYKLTSATKDVDAVNEIDSFVVTVTDNSSASASATVTVNINDDAPVLDVTQGVDQGIVPATLVGELVHMGADVSHDVPGSHVTWNSLPTNLTSNGVAVTYTGLGTNTVTGMAGDKAVFTLTGNPNGTYQYTQFSQLATKVSANFNQALDDADAFYLYKNGTLRPTVDTTNEWVVKITAGSDEVSPTSGGLAVDSDGLDVGDWLNSGEAMRFEFNEGANQTSAVQISVNGLTDNWLNYEKLNWTAHYTDGTSASGSIDQYAASGIFTITAPDGKYLDFVDLVPNTGFLSLTYVHIESITVTSQQGLPFGFTATDGDGDSVSGTLSIDGSLVIVNDAPTVSHSGNLNVAESGLPSGTNALANTEQASGTFTLHDDQGMGDISSVTIGGTTFTIGSAGLTGLIGTTVNTANGKVEITGFNTAANGTDGTFSYEYTLTTASNATTDSFAVSVSDGAISSSNATVTINIADDKPIASNDATSQTEASSVTYTGVNGLTFNDIFGADGAGTPALVSASYGSQSHTFTSATDSHTFNLGAAGTATVYGDGHYTFNAADVKDNVTANISYVIKDSGGSQSDAVLSLSTADRSEVSATNDPANASEGYWQAGADLTHSVTIGSSTWSSGTTSYDIQTNTLNINNVSNRSSASINSSNFEVASADTLHPASVSFNIDLSDFSGFWGDRWQAVVKDSNGNTVASLLNQSSNPDGGSVSIPGITAPGTYHIEFTLFDNTIGTNSNRADLTVTNLDFHAYTYTPGTPHTIAVTAPDSEWHAASIASGNVMFNDSPGSEGAAVTLISSSMASNVAVDLAGVNINGTYGTLHIEADGDYTYTPTAADLPAGAVDTFTYTLAQADGDSLTAALTVTLANHEYGATGTTGNDLLFGSSSADTLTGLEGNDHLLGNAGNDTLYGGDGTDILEGGDNDDSLYGGAASDSLLGGNGADILVGGQGDDILVGGSGSDTFRYQSGDLTNAPYGDVIKDFKVATIANGGDVLDVSDLLPTLTQSQLTSGGYLKFEYVSGDANTTVVKLSIDADGSAVGGSVYTPLATITMTGAGTIDPTAIMNKLLANGEIQF